jgi:hypothetical protein
VVPVWNLVDVVGFPTRLSIFPKAAAAATFGVAGRSSWVLLPALGAKPGHVWTSNCKDGTSRPDEDPNYACFPNVALEAAVGVIAMQMKECPNSLQG